MESQVLQRSGAHVVHERAQRWEDVGESTFDSADALLVWRMGGAGLDAATLARFRRLRALVRIGVGFDGIDLQAAGKLGIAVCNVPAYGTEEVADTAFAHILALYRKTSLLGRRVASGHISSSLNSRVQVEAQGAPRIRAQRLGIIGLGRIGTAVALRARPFGFAVGFYDPFVSDGWHKALGGLTRFDSVEALAESSDCISLHCTHNPSSANLVSADVLRRLPRGARVVNTARGGLLDDEALAAALRDGRLGGVAVDCQAGEPDLHALPLTRLLREEAEPTLNLSVTPHAAFYSDAAVVEMRTTAAEEARRAIGLRLPRETPAAEAVTAVLGALGSVVNSDQLRAADGEQVRRRWVDGHVDRGAASLE
jgi:C-terminal binding protein